MFHKIASPYKLIITICLVSRIFILALGKVSSMYFQRFDKSTLLSQSSPLFNFLESWDSVHFIKIALNGYDREHLLPFFPLFPLICRVFRIFDPFTTAVLLNNILFIFSSLILYKLSLQFFNKKIAFLSTLYFIINPASIVFSSMYSESLFTFLFFLSIWFTIQKKYIFSSILLSLTALCRSNGVIFIIFLKTIQFPIILLPISLFQLYSLGLIWKSSCSVRLFVPYSYIQKKYWQQGFLSFFTINNIPNILIGLPVILLSIFFVFSFYSSLIKNFINKQKTADKTSKRSWLKILMNIEAVEKNNMKLFWISLISDPFMCENGHISEKLILLLIFQILITIFFIHWNIFMRFISFNPIIYWIAAHLTMIHFGSKIFNAIFTFFLIYGILYVVTFSCFYPPA